MKKESFKDKVARLRVLEKIVKETQRQIDDDFINYYRAEKPANVEALEKYFNAGVERLVVLKYEDDFDNWCDAVLVKMTDGGIKTFDISRSDQWESDEEAIILEKVKDEKISSIISDIFEDFPYINIEHL